MIIRALVILGSVLMLPVAIIYGPGRALTIIPADHEQAHLLYLTRIAEYVFFLLGAIASAKSSRGAWVFLFCGLLGRTYMEVSFSFATWAIITIKLLDLGRVIWILIFYVLTFILPALLFLDSLRDTGCSKRLQSEE